MEVCVEDSWDRVLEDSDVITAVCKSLAGVNLTRSPTRYICPLLQTRCGPVLLDKPSPTNLQGARYPIRFIAAGLTKSKSNLENW